jgi:hypothetical protein
MKLKKYGPNVTELAFDDGTRVLFSYETPVAAWIPGFGFQRTNRYYSRATASHIRNWLIDNDAPSEGNICRHEQIEDLLRDVKQAPEECEGCSTRDKFISFAFVDGEAARMCTACFDDAKREGKDVTMTKTKTRA